ncbi:MAG: DUF2911 domain-containing protein [Flammeovirgaceae bacterium]|nr:DUF2911 domain-containing protein [Flammeovirgaceae bacterium]
MRNFIFVLLTVFCSCQPSEKKINKETSARTEPTAYIILPQQVPDTLKGSLKAEAKGMIGDVTIKINYHSPAVRSRIIWGGLVANDKVWVTGAHMATSIEISSAIKISGTEIAAGKYALFTIPSKDVWTVIINKNWQQHLADEYDPKDDVLRFTVTPQIQEINQERLMYSVEDNEIKMRWEKVLISIPIN